MPETRLWSSAKCSLKTEKEKLTRLRLFLLSNARCGAGSRVKQIAALSLLKRGKKKATIWCWLQYLLAGEMHPKQ